MIFTESQLLLKSFCIYHTSFNTHNNHFVIPIVKGRDLRHKEFYSNLSKILL